MKHYACTFPKCGCTHPEFCREDDYRARARAMTFIKGILLGAFIVGFIFIFTSLMNGLQ